MKFTKVENQFPAFQIKALGISDDEIFEKGKLNVMRALRILAETNDILTPNPIEVKEDKNRPMYPMYRYFYAEVLIEPKKVI